MSSPASTPSHFDRLPTELLKHIVLMVHQQDTRYRKSGLGGTPTYPPDDFDSDSEDYEPPRATAGASKFSAWHGRGISALSLLNKRLRELCLPFLCPVARAEQFTAGLYQFRLVPQAILEGVQRLDLRSASDSRFIAAATALPHLPNVTALELSLQNHLPWSANSRYGVSDSSAAASRLLATNAFRDHNTRISTLILHGRVRVPFDREYITTFADPGTLRRLEFRDNDSFLFESSRPNSSVRLHTLTSFSNLTHLDISGASALEWEVLLSNDRLWPNEARFQAVQSFRAKSWTWWIFSFVEKCMPNLAKLDLDFPAHSEELEDLPSSPTLASLDSLSITGPPEMFAVLAQLNLPKLATVNLSILSPDASATVDCTALLPVNTILPLRVALRLTIPATMRREHADEFAAWCKRHDINLSWTSSSPLAFFDQPLTMSADDSCVLRAADAVLETLAWASDHGKRLRDLGDTAGLRELAELVKPLCERRMIEEM